MIEGDFKRKRRRGVEYGVRGRRGRRKKGFEEWENKWEGKR